MKEPSFANLATAPGVHAEEWQWQQREWLGVTAALGGSHEAVPRWRPSAGPPPSCVGAMELGGRVKSTIVRRTPPPAPPCPCASSLRCHMGSEFYVDPREWGSSELEAPRGGGGSCWCLPRATRRTWSARPALCHRNISDTTGIPK